MRIPFNEPSTSPSPDARPRLILLHGLASSPREFALLAQPLRRAGVDLVTPEIEGYSHASLDSAASWKDWVDATCLQLDLLARPDGAPFVLGGLCTGAMLALEVARRRRDPAIRGIALLSPLFACDGWGLPWWYRLRHAAYRLGLDGMFTMRERPPFGLKNERMREWVRSQMQTASDTIVGPPSVPLRVIRQSEQLSLRAVEALDAILPPVLAIHARDDEICRLTSVQAIVASRAAPVELKILHDSYHMIVADNDRALVARLLADHLSHCIGAPAKGLATHRRPALERLSHSTTP